MKLTDKIEIELTDADTEYIKSGCRDDISRYLAFLRDRSFEVGDVLVKKVKKRKWQTNKNGAMDCIDYWDYVKVPYRKVPAKFVVVHVDENGIPTVKRLSVKGHFTNTIQSLADLDFRNEIYEEDPDYMEAMLLDFDEYDPIMVERNRKKNKKL